MLAERNFSMEQLMPLIRESLESGTDVSFSPKGISMLPLLRQGRDTVTLSPVNGNLKKYDVALYRRDNGAYVLHRVAKVGDTYTFVGDNQFALERGIRHDQILAVMSAFTRDGKEIPVTDRGYRCYCVLWSLGRPFRHFPRRLINKLRRIAHKIGISR